MLTKESVTFKSPAVYSKSQSPSLSKRYVFVPTFEILEKFEDQGWNVSSVKQTGMGNYSTHEVRLRNGELPKVGDSIFEAIIKNSHDGSSRLSFTSGLFRLVCSNGLTVPTSISERFNVKHINFEMNDVRELTENFSKRLPLIKGSMDQMMSRELSTSDKIKLTSEALKIRFESQEKFSNKTIESILKPNREEDQNNDLWTVFNVIQEKFIKGGFTKTTDRNYERVVKGVSGILNTSNINTKLWELAQTYCD